MKRLQNLQLIDGLAVINKIDLIKKDATRHEKRVDWACSAMAQTPDKINKIQKSLKEEY